MGIVASLGFGVLLLVTSVLFDKITKITNAQFKIAMDADKNFKSLNAYCVKLESRIIELEGAIDR